MQLIYKFGRFQEETPVILVHFVSIVKVLVIQKSMSHKYLEDLSLGSMNETHIVSNLTDADNYIEELTEEEAKGVFIELIVDMLTVVNQQLPE